MSMYWNKLFGGRTTTEPASPFGAPRDMSQVLNELKMISHWSEKEIRARAPNIDDMIRLLADVKSKKVETPATAKKKPVRDTNHPFHKAAEIITTTIGTGSQNC